MTPAQPSLDDLVGAMKDIFGTRQCTVSLPELFQPHYQEMIMNNPKPSFPEIIYCPFNVDILMWYHSRCEPHPRIDIPAVISFTNELLRLGIIEPCKMATDVDGTNIYQTTPIGSAWVKAICNVPMPKTAFVDEQGRVIQ